MNIRMGCVQDSDAISLLLTRLATKFIVSGFKEEGRSNLLNSMTVPAVQCFFEDGYRYHLAEVDGQIIGVVGTRDDVHLFHLFVDERFQGQGISSKLWAIAQAACLAGDNPGYFTVNSSLNAQAVYLGWGFSPIGGIREGGGVRDMPMRMDI
ncbi:MAG: GNAT superfamily N-acetyltransferase [Candidatus Azotimanducaceae bacterium]